MSKGKPCAKSMPTPKVTSATGGRTGSSLAQPSATAQTTAPNVYQCREWIPDEPVGDRLLRALREAGGPMTTRELCAACDSTENTVTERMKPLIAGGKVETAFVKLRCGNAMRLNRAYRLKAFTLVDILVSITIIALLFSILLPALSRMKEVQRDQQCTMQVRMVTHGIVGYANEHNRLPVVPDCWIMGAEGPVTGATILRAAIAEWIEPSDVPAFQTFTRPWCCELDGLGLWQLCGVSYIYAPSGILTIGDYERNPASAVWADWKAQRNGVTHIGRFDGAVVALGR